MVWLVLKLPCFLRDNWYFETIDLYPSQYGLFHSLYAFGFCGLLRNWIHNDLKESQAEFTEKLVNLSKTSIYLFRYIWDS
ncbi:TetR-like C-terminal domain-containing protein [Oceanobacillus rekensis]|uniref:TetR-like C-terminal domain-containing protein n=1 Tax=Oceanobacillus rekensis TaxID=937927 RepID=UPI001FEC5D62|nr:TetR-like C-terminal domain-containing protein [Oceanobacillus rekensis]